MSFFEITKNISNICGTLIGVVGMVYLWLDDYPKAAAFFALAAWAKP